MTTIKGMFLVLIFSFSAFAQNLPYDYTQLQSMNFESLSKLVLQRLAHYHETKHRAKIPANIYTDDFLKVLKIVLGRPDSDNIRRRLFAPLRKEMSLMEIFDSTMTRLIDDSIGCFKENKRSPKIQSTCSIILTNVIAELKPEMERNTLFLSWIQKIKDADLKHSKKTRSFQLLRSMRVSKSPSKIAAEVLDSESQ